MRTAGLLTVLTCFSSHQMSAPWCPQLNKFKQVSRLGNQMSLPGRVVLGPGVPVQRGWGQGPCTEEAGESLYSELQVE